MVVDQDRFVDVVGAGVVPSTGSNANGWHWTWTVEIELKQVAHRCAASGGFGVGCAAEGSGDAFDEGVIVGDCGGRHDPTDPLDVRWKEIGILGGHRKDVLFN